MARSGEHRPGPRARRREATEAEILKVAREHLARSGGASLSLRAIARDLGMVSSGIYRYVKSRDDLLTRLVVDSYASLAEAVHTAHDVVPRAELDERWEAVGFALRGWALDHPHDFALLYGSPVPDYEAPADRTTEAGTAVLAVLVALLDDAKTAGRLATDGPGRHGHDATLAVAPLLQEPLFAAVSFGPDALARGLSAWTLLLGAVTSEVFEQLGPVPDPAALFRVHLETARVLVFTPQQSSTALSTAVGTA